LAWGPLRFVAAVAHSGEQNDRRSCGLIPERLTVTDVQSVGGLFEAVHLIHLVAFDRIDPLKLVRKSAGDVSFETPRS
jgi:hypothetical protein